MKVHFIIYKGIFANDVIVIVTYDITLDYYS